MPQRHPQFGGEPQQQSDKNQPAGQPDTLFTFDLIRAIFLSGTAWLIYRHTRGAIRAEQGYRE